MPRASSPVGRVPRSVREIATDLARWMERHAFTQAEMAERLRVRQPQISRILSANFSLRSRAVQEWCSMAAVPMTTPDEASRTRNRQELVDLLDDVWDGTVEDIGRVAALLHAAAELRRGAR